MKSATTTLLALVFGCSVVLTEAADFSEASSRASQRSAASQRESIGAESVVELIVTSQESNPFLPWQKMHPNLRQGYGVIVGDSQVLTTESIVRNHTMVEIRKAGTGEKIPAAVKISDCQANVALLKILDPEKRDGLVPLKFTDHVSKNAEVEIIQFDETSQIQHGEAEVVQIAITQLPYAPYHSLTFSLLIELNVNGEGAAVISNGKLAGLIMRYDNTTRTGAMLPYCVLKHFIEDAEEPPYKGFAFAGFIWSPLIDPAKRAYLNVNRDEQGILVLECLAGTGAFETLKSNDVIIEWDGQAIDNLGFYEDPDFGRLALPYLVKGRRKPGDVVPVKIIRDRTNTTLNVKLGQLSDAYPLIPENVTNEQVEYLIDGGFVIRELTGRYLKAYGPQWKRNVDSRLVHLYLTQKDTPETLGDRVVILAAVLPDQINIGYHHFRDAIITKLNGKSIRNMTDVFRTVDMDGSIERLTLQSVGVDLVLDQDELATANSRLARLYRIPSLRYQRKPSGGIE